jgi:hypothetical protein
MLAVAVLYSWMQRSQCSTASCSGCSSGMANLATKGACAGACSKDPCHVCSSCRTVSNVLISEAHWFCCPGGCRRPEYRAKGSSQADKLPRNPAGQDCQQQRQGVGNSLCAGPTVGCCSCYCRIRDVSMQCSAMMITCCSSHQPNPFF